MIEKYLAILTGGYLIATLLAPLWEQNVLFVHTLFEAVGILISFSTFLLVWNTYDKTYSINHLIGFGFLAVAALHGQHAYYHVGVQNLESTDLSTRYWIMGRLVEALVLYCVSRGPSNQLHVNKWLGLAGVSTFLFGLSVIVLYFPDVTLVLAMPGELTPEKIALEYSVLFFSGLSIYHLQKRLDDAGIEPYRDIYMALLLIIPAELMFTLFEVVTSFYSTYGHVLKIVYYYYLYRAVFVNAIAYPYDKLAIEHKRLDQRSKELQKATQELQEQQQREKRLLAEYEHLREEMARFERLNVVAQTAASVAHEIRNPMAVIRGYMQFMMKKIGSEHQKYIYLMINELDRANSIITDFLSLAKNQTSEKTSQNLNQIIMSIYPLLQSEALRKGMDIHLKLDDKIPDVILNDKEIKQLLLNFSANAMDAMGDAGQLIIETQVQAGRVSLLIADTGCGIPQDRLDKVFDPFYTTKPNGTGLGLAVSLSIIERHHATIQVESQEGKGTKFTVNFPVSADYSQ